MRINKMAVSGDITFAQDDHRSVKLHPYLITLMRWCVSSLWSTATLFLHRIMTAQLPPITASKSPSAKPSKARPPGTDHLHPEPKVECVVLHQPSEHRLDVIFVHGLYGSLGNTWRQGDWRNKYKIGPNRVPLRRQNSLPSPCNQKSKTNSKENEHIYKPVNVHHNDATNKDFSDTNTFNYADSLHKQNAFRTAEEEFYANIENIIAEENVYINEKFYNNFLNKVDVTDNYEKQAQFIHDLFEKEIHCDNNCDCIKDERKREQIAEDINIYRNNTMGVINRYLHEMDANINANKYDDSEVEEAMNKYFNNEMNIVNINLRESEMECNGNINISDKMEINISRYDNTKGTDINRYVNKEVETVVNINLHTSKMEVNGNVNRTNVNESNETEEDINRYVNNEAQTDVNINRNKSDVNDNACTCKTNENKCEVGCGCICDECYSPCWPRDWIKVDYPDARVISINYTSDPHLWRPLWVKENKRLRLHERAEQMMQQLTELGVGNKPIVWVGHSKGGLFIKQIYCEAYEAYLQLNERMNLNAENDENDTNETEQINKAYVNGKQNVNDRDDTESHGVTTNVHNSIDISKENPVSLVNNIYRNDIMSNETISHNIDNDKRNTDSEITSDIFNKNDKFEVEREPKNKVFTELQGDSITKYRQGNSKINNDGDIEINNEEINEIEVNTETIFKDETMSSKREGDCSKVLDLEGLKKRSSLWLNSAGFMYYSVPHRGSPLADIKTPITARSVELLEISKDCPLVLSLQERWLEATSSSRPAVRSLVETCRTLMSVLYLRIVSVDSADPGIGALCGVSVDHREICKPSSRRCLLYTELMNLIHAALNRCECL